MFVLLLTYCAPLDHVDKIMGRHADWLARQCSAGRFLVAVRAKLLHALAEEWSEVTGEAKESLVIFLQEIPGANTLEDGAIGPEITEDLGAVY